MGPAEAIEAVRAPLGIDPAGRAGTVSLHTSPEPNGSVMCPGSPILVDFVDIDSRDVLAII